MPRSKNAGAFLNRNNPAGNSKADKEKSTEKDEQIIEINFESYAFKKCTAMNFTNM